MEIASQFFFNYSVNNRRESFDSVSCWNCHKSSIAEMSSSLFYLILMPAQQQLLLSDLSTFPSHRKHFTIFIYDNLIWPSGERIVRVFLLQHLFNEMQKISCCIISRWTEWTVWSISRERFFYYLQKRLSHNINRLTCSVNSR